MLAEEILAIAPGSAYAGFGFHLRDRLGLCRPGGRSCFAEMGHRAVCVDNDEAKVATLRQGGVPIYEQHLADMLAKHLNRGVAFTSDLSAAVTASEAIFIAVGTPQGDAGAADLSYVEAVVAEIARSISGYKVIIEKSTVPVYTNEWIRRVRQRYGVDEGVL